MISLGLAAWSPAQQAAELAAELGSPDPLGRRFDQLLRLGPAAAKAAAASLSGEVQGVPNARFRQTVTLLRELGPDSLAELDVLWRKAASSGGEARCQILEALLCVVPHLGAAAKPHYSRIAGMMHDLAHETKDAQLRERAVRTHCQALWVLGVRNRSLLVAGSAADLLAELSTLDRKDLVRCEVAAVLLSYVQNLTRQQRVRALREMRLRLGQPIQPSIGRMHINGELCRFDTGPGDHRRWALALLRMKPPQSEQLLAHRYLLEHGLSHERWRAMEFLRSRPAALAEAETNLARVAADKQLDKHLRYEAVTSLGFLPELSKATQVALELLWFSKDKAMVARVKAVRQRQKR